MRTAVVILAATLAGCASAPKVVTKAETVEIPVRVPCLQDAPAEPEKYADAKMPKGADDGPERYRLSAAANAQREAYLAALRPYLEACR